MSSVREGLLQIPFSREKEVRAWPRYHWDNAQRGTDPFVILQYTLQGRGILEIDGVRHPVPPGHAMIALVPEKSRYYCAENQPWVFSWLNFYGELGLRLWKDLRDQAGPVLALAPSAVRLLRGLAARASRRGPIDPYETSKAAYGFYLETLRHLPKRVPARPFQDVILYFQAHYQKGIRMKEVAALAGMSREHFTRVFAREMGMPPAAYLRRIRLEAAARLLRGTDLPAAEIALRTGWASPTKLDFFFKRHFGVSSRQYRPRDATKRL
jgi:AraC-like DNA-binding protein